MRRLLKRWYRLKYLPFKVAFYRRRKAELTQIPEGEWLMQREEELKEKQLERDCNNDSDAVIYLEGQLDLIKEIINYGYTENKWSD